MPMEFWVENIIMYGCITVCFLLTIVGMAGNLWMLLLACGYAIFTDFTRFTPQVLLWLVLIFLFGELWEFVVGFFGVKRKNVSWLGVFIIGIGTVIGAVAGTFVLPVLGSLIGGAIGACGAAYLYEYRKSQNQADAKHLAWIAFKAQFLAALSKIISGVAMGLVMISNLTW